MRKIIHTIKLSPAVIIPSTLLFLTLTSALVLLSSNSNADTTSATASVTVPDTCYMSSTSTTHTGTVNGGTYTENFGGESTVTVTCNDRNGYSVYAVGYSNDIEGTNGLIGTSTGLVIPSGTSTSTNVSNWAMKLTPGTGTFAPTILSDTNGSFANYHIVPTTTTKVATLTSDINVSNLSQFKTSYAVAVSPTQAADTYVGKVKYTVVHPNYVTPSGDLESYPITIGFGANTSSIIIDGTAYTSASTTPNIEYGTHTISGTFPEGYKLNSWSSTGNITISSTTSNPTSISVTGTGTLSVSAKVDCAETITGYMQDISSANAYCDGASGTLTDRRDSKTYTVKKLADGKLWMTENLAIDLTATSYDTLYGTGTNAGKMTNATSEALGYLKGTKTGTASGQWAMAAVKKTWTSSYSYSQPWIAVDSSTSGVCSNASTWCVTTTGAWSWDTVTPATINGTTSKVQGKLGVYYNYCAASAGSYCWGGSGTSSSGSPSSDPNTSSLRDITSDICPYGWRLPTSTSSGEFQALYAAYSSNATSFQTALSTPLSGYFYYGKARNQGSYGYFWSSTWYGSTGMCFLGVNSTSVNPSNNVDRYGGYSVRCVFGP